MRVAYRAQRSNRRFQNAPAVKQEIEQTIDGRVKAALIALFQKRVENWRGQPEFRARKFITGDAVSVTVFPVGEHADKWRFVSRGTRPHKIRPKNASILFFTIDNEPVFTKEVNHPGTQARNFEEAIAAEYKADFSNEMRNAFRRGIRRN